MSSSIPKPRTASFASTHSPTTINIPLDSRVVLSKRRSGWVRYIGKIKNEAGEWYGIALDEGKGENDGSYEKERYFDCPSNHGVFVRRKETFCVKEYPLSRTKSPPPPLRPRALDAAPSAASGAFVVVAAVVAACSSACSSAAAAARGWAGTAAPHASAARASWHWRS